jgi:hypothetical protein
MQHQSAVQNGKHASMRIMAAPAALIGNDFDLNAGILQMIKIALAGDGGSRRHEANSTQGRHNRERAKSIRASNARLWSNSQ